MLDLEDTGRLTTKAVGLSDVGLVRTRNEDSYLILEGHQIFCVADGMGGHQHGEVASQKCIDAIRRWFSQDVSKDIVNRFAKISQTQKRVRSGEEADLIAAVEYANFEIYKTSKTRIEYHGMGTTLVAARLYGRHIFVVYSGDSRIYRLRKNRLIQMSEDHSLVVEYLKKHLIAPSEARYFPYRNILTKAMGLRETAEIDWFRRRIMPKDLYLLCSDGLTDMLSDSVIAKILRLEESLDVRCNLLVQAAKKLGGLDNITVVLVEVLSV